MNRYSMLWGTSDTGEYRRLWNSKKLGDFLSSIGATDPASVADAAQNILRSFGNYPDYSEQPTDDKPVSVHYAPMHLYKLPEFPGSLKPFCAWSVTGAENRPGGRNSTYSHTVFFPYESMLGADKSVNYLDILFGARCLSWQDVKAFREKTRTPAFDAMPQKIYVEFTDLKLALYAASVLLEAKGEKNLVIRLEKNCLFNRRSISLLSQIYALLPPRLAMETGFATYHPVEDIAGISSKNSICVFVVPASAEIKQCEVEKNIILDLSESNSGIPLQQSPLTETLLQWSKLSEENRSASYEVLFEDAPAYLDGSLFIQRSKEFFENIRSFETWLSSSGEGTIRSLNDIRTIFSKHEKWAQIPWYKSQFRQMLPRLLPKGIKYSSLLNDAVTRYQMAQTDSEKKEAGELYRVGSQFGEIDIPGLCGSIAKRQNELTEAAFLLKIREAEEKYASLEKNSKDALLSQKNDFEAQMQATQKEYEGKLAAAEKQHMAKLAEQKEAAKKETAAACAAAEGRLKKAEEVYRQMRDKQAMQDKKLQESAVALSAEQRKHEETRNRIFKLKENELALQHDLESAKHRIAHLGNWPRFLTKMPWWLSLVASMMIGSILVGAAWGITAFVGKEEEPKVVVTESTSTIPPTVVTTTEPLVETSEEVSGTTELQPDPDFVYSDWQDEETARQLRLAVPDIATVQTDESVQALCPAELAGYTVQALLSIDGITFTPSEDLSQKIDFENYALLLKKAEDTDEPDLSSLCKPGLVIQKDDQLLLSYGSDQMMNAAIRTIQTIAAVPENDYLADTTDEYGQMSETRVETFEMRWVLGDGNTIDLGAALASMTESDAWWRTLSGWTTDRAALQSLEPDSVPIWSATIAEKCYCVLDFFEDQQSAQDFVDNYEAPVRLLADRFVLIAISKDSPLENSTQFSEE